MGAWVWRNQKRQQPGNAFVFKKAVFLHEQQIVLKLPQIALRVQIIDRRQQSGNPVVILLISVAVTDFPVAVSDKCKRKGLGRLIIGWQFSFEILKPFVKSAVSADLTCSVEHFQIIVA